MVKDLFWKLLYSAGYFIIWSAGTGRSKSPNTTGGQAVKITLNIPIVQRSKIV